MLFSIVGNAQRVNLTGTWKAADNPNIMYLAQTGDYLTFTNEVSHVGAGYMVSPTRAKLIQTFNTGGGCSVDMSLVFYVKSRNLIDLAYEFLETKCGFIKGATGQTTLTRQ
jgi:hypothetical protein